MVCQFRLRRAQQHYRRPFLLLSTFGSRERWSSLYCQSATLFVALLAVYHYSRFFFLFALVVVASAIYYRKRFKIAYPGF